MKRSNHFKLKRFTFFLLLSTLLVLVSLTSTALANTGTTPQKEVSASLMEKFSDAKESQRSPSNFLSPYAFYGYYNAGTDVSITSHNPALTYTYSTGFQIPVSAVFENSGLAPNIECYFGVWDYTLNDYVKLYYVGDLVTAQEEVFAKIDTSGLTAYNNRYSIDAFIYDATTGVEDIDVYDYFDLNIRNLTTPTISSATSSGVHSVKLSWSAQYGVTGYGIYKATSATGTYSYVGSAATNTFNCTGLATGKNYYFKVRAYCSGGAKTSYGGFSAYKIGKAMPPTPTVTAVAASYTSIKLSWPAISGASGYQIYRSPTATGTYTYLGATTGTSYIHAGLATGKTYYYKVRMYHTESTGTKYYSSFSPYKAIRPVPSAPKLDVTLLPSNTEIKFSWAPVAGATKYEIYEGGKYTDSTYTLVYTANSTTTSWTKTGIPPGEARYYIVRACHLEGTVNVNGLYSIPTTHYTVGKPAIVTKPELGGSCVTISWASVNGVDNYEIYRMNREGGYDLIGTNDLLNRSFLDTGLSPNTQYTYQVRAFHNEGATKIYGPSSEPMTATTTDTIVLGTTELTMYGLIHQGIAADALHGVRINWTTVAGANGYIVEFKDLDGTDDYVVLGVVTGWLPQYDDWDNIDEAYGHYSYRVTPIYDNPATGVYVEGITSNTVTFIGSLL